MRTASSNNKLEFKFFEVLLHVLLFVFQYMYMRFLIAQQSFSLCYFFQGTQKKRITTDFLPKGHTCSNTLHLPRGAQNLPLLADGELFKLYDYGFQECIFWGCLTRSLTISFIDSIPVQAGLHFNMLNPSSSQICLLLLNN